MDILLIFVVGLIVFILYYLEEPTQKRPQQASCVISHDKPEPVKDVEPTQELTLAPEPDPTPTLVTNPFPMPEPAIEKPKAQELCAPSEPVSIKESVIPDTEITPPSSHPQIKPEHHDHTSNAAFTSPSFAHPQANHGNNARSKKGRKALFAKTINKQP
ncbi:MAG: hypothetical protein V1753_00705 [Pseudomonadota bacterium]